MGKRISDRLFRVFGTCGLATAVFTGCSDDSNPGRTEPAPMAKLVAGFGGQRTLLELRTLTSSAQGTRFIRGEGYRAGDATPSGTFDVNTTWNIERGDLRLDYHRHLTNGCFAIDRHFEYTELLRNDGGWREGVDNIFDAPGGAMPSDRWSSGRRQQRLLHPEIIVRDLIADPSRIHDVVTEVVDGVTYNRLEASDPTAPTTLWIDSVTGRLSKITSLENEHVTGDVTLEARYDDWQIVDGGPVMPRRVVILLGGQVVHEETRTNIVANPSLSAEAFTVPAGGTLEPVDGLLAKRGEKSAQFNQQFASIGITLDGPKTIIDPVQLASGIWHIRGATHNSMVVEQQSGIVVFVSHLSDTRMRHTTS